MRIEYYIDQPSCVVWQSQSKKHSSKKYRGMETIDSDEAATEASGWMEKYSINLLRLITHL